MTVLKNKYIALFLISWNLIFAGCHKDEDRIEGPLLFTGDVLDINESGAIFAGNFKNVDHKKVEEYGFLWRTYSSGELNRNPEYERSLRHIIKGPPENNVSHFVNDASLKPDEIYYVRTFVRYPEKIFYGNTVSFLSAGSRLPVIRSIEPETAYFGDTVIIHADFIGVDFNEIRVLFNDQVANRVRINDTSIWVAVPVDGKSKYYFKGKMEVVVKKYKDHISDIYPYTISSPEILSINPVEPLSLDTITIRGHRFPPLYYTKVLFDDLPAKIISVSSEEIKILAPALFEDKTCTITLEDGITMVDAGEVKVRAPVVIEKFPQEVFSGEKLLLSGLNLHNRKLNILIGGKLVSPFEIKNDLLMVTVPDGLCGITQTLEMQLGDAKRSFEGGISFKQPQNVTITTTENNYFDGKIFLTGEYLPNIQYYPNGSPRIELKFNGISSSFYSYHINAGSGNSMEAIVPANIPAPDGWLNLKVGFCETSVVKYDSVFHIPPPVITSVPDTIYKYFGFTIMGENLNFSHANTIYLDEMQLVNQKAENPHKIRISSTPLHIQDGDYILRVMTNGQFSNEVSVYLKDPYELVSQVPVALGFNPVFFIKENEIYIGGGQYATNDFFSFNLISRTWHKKENLPVVTGASANGNLFGYLSFNRSLFRYDFINDQWDAMPELNKETRFRNHYPGLMHGEKFFIFPYCISDNNFYFDTDQNTWHTGGKIGSTLGSCYRLSGIQTNDRFYLFNGPEVHKYDPYAETFISNHFVTNNHNVLRSGYHTVTGFEYEGMGYLFHNLKWLISNLKGPGYKELPAPGGQTKVFRTEDYAYSICSSNIWRIRLKLLNADH
jgi:hypothetical protein